ncbi:serine protease 44-like, partial [Anoplophora glabripennis]|uniref:serine protease 44-like n=1 Tax=Anoplophora glabripennis TaxID=217634 RepID=UPI000C76C86C
SKILKKVEVPFVNHTQCQTLLRSTRLGKRFNLDKSFMCAGGEKGRDACMGDGGSPLMCATHLGSDRYFQAGMVSWGIDCGTENVPGVYTDVPEAVEWIKNELNNRQLYL